MMTPLVKLKRQCRNYTISDTKLYAKILASVSIITPVQFCKRRNIYILDFRYEEDT